MELLARATRVVGMTLAAILLCGALCITPVPSLIATAAIPSAPQSASSDKPAGSSPQDSSSQNQSGQAQSGQNQTSAPPQNSPSPAQTSSSPAASSATKSAAGQQTSAGKRAHKKIAADCVPAPASSGPSASEATSRATSGQGAAGTNSSAANAPVNCPPPKVIVRQGSTKEPSIELIGGAAGDQQSQRDLANQHLQATDENLKKIAGEQLSANQQVLVTQIRQYMQQSRSAVQAGEFERADTLAKKAQQLSEELVKPAAQ
jgi:hypothetical protein